MQQPLHNILLQPESGADVLERHLAAAMVIEEDERDGLQRRDLQVVRPREVCSDLRARERERVRVREESALALAHRARAQPRIRTQARPRAAVTHSCGTQ